MNNDKYSRYSEMILLALDGRMSDEQFVEFDRLLREDAIFRQYYLRFMAVNASLGAIDKFPAARIVDEEDAVLSRDLWSELAREEQTAETVEIEVPKQISPVVKKNVIERAPRRINKFSLVSALVSAAALVFLLLYIHFVPVKPMVLVGKLSKTIDAQWQDASGQITQGCDLYAGPMSLVRGYAEIVLDGGAVIVVQGPSQFTLESDQQLYLQQGKIVARKGQGDEQAFLVRTPHATVVDYGTEFAVQVDSAEKTETYVYEGQVQLRDSSNPIKFMKSILLKAGQGATADSQSRLAGKDVDPKTFVRPAEMDVRYRAQNDTGYYRWRAWVYQLHRDPSLIGHYFFEKSMEQPNRLVNGVFPEQESMQGRFGDEVRNAPTWVQGRWPQKDAVRFERGKKQTIVIPADAVLSITYPLTISTWVYFPDDALWGGHLIACRKNQQINYQFSLFDKNYVFSYQINRFEFRQYEPGDPGFYSNPFTPEPRKWYHFAVVFDGAELKFYINGKLFQTDAYEGLTEGAPAEIVIGAVKNDGYAFEEGDFDGVIDELMLFNRELSLQEIRTIYENGKP